MTTHEHDISTDELKEFLLDPRTHAEGGPVELRETHISIIALTPRHAYKLSKPVNFGFLDFSTREARYVNCWNQILLNRRWSTDIYEQVLPIVNRSGRLILGNGDIHQGDRCVDWVVRMRRLDEDRTLEAAIARKECLIDEMDRILSRLKPVFESAPRIPLQGKKRLVDRLRGAVTDNIDSLRDMAQAGELSSEDVNRLHSMQCEFLTVREPLFDERQERGWVREGHGDLRAEHIYIRETIDVVDCVEFNLALRQNDLLDEFCFLATDLERLGRRDLADQLLAKYRRAFRDPFPRELASFYMSYRYAVRAKVSGLRAQEEPESTSKPFWDKTRQFLDKAIRVMESVHHASAIFFCGLSGSGKSTVARALAERLGAQYLSSDVIRKELFGLKPEDRSSDPKLYSREASEQTYAEMHQRALCGVCHQMTVVLDATYSRREDRDRLRQLLTRCGTECLCVECHCPREVAEERIARRQQQGTNPSDADVHVLAEQISRYDPPLEIPKEYFISIDTRHPLEENVAEIVSRLPV